ncbi:MAG TPA: DUF362 domain-containing protein [Chitinispirillaceae bacterium]|nr:DUF362 domain-containing protein [Chitinispirillaceae bacterium]
MEKDSAISRRSFLKGTAATAAITLINGAAWKVSGNTLALNPGPGNKWPGRVVINFNKNAVIMNGINATAVPEVIRAMVDEGILCLTGLTTLGEAWKAVFPSTLTAQSKIAIKVPLGCATQKMAPHWASVKAITDGLQQMDFNGTKFPASNITIYDSRCSNRLSSYGYNTANFGNQIKIVYEEKDGSGYTDGAKNNQYNRYAPSLHDADFLINVFRPGGHSSYVEGFTLGFKNHYGTYPAEHSNTAAPGYLRDINCTGVVYNKNVLSVCAGIFGAQENSGNPGSSDIPYYNYARQIDSSISNDRYPPCTIIMSTDPVTAEMQTIKMMRLNNGKGYGVNDMPKYLRASGGVSGALNDATYNIGIIDESQMDIRRIINGEAIGVSTRRQYQKGVDSGVLTFTIESSRIHPVSAGFSMPAVGAVKVRITDLAGNLVQEISSDYKGKIVWNGQTSKGGLVSPGMYFVTLSSGSFRETKKISISGR